MLWEGHRSAATLCNVPPVDSERHPSLIPWLSEPSSSLPPDPTIAMHDRAAAAAAVMSQAIQGHPRLPSPLWLTSISLHQLSLSLYYCFAVCYSWINDLVEKFVSFTLKPDIYSTVLISILQNSVSSRQLNGCFPSRGLEGRHPHVLAQHIFLMALKIREARAFALGHVVFRLEVVYRSDTKSWRHVLTWFVLLLIILAQNRWVEVIKSLCGKIHRLLLWKCFI